MRFCVLQRIHTRTLHTSPGCSMPASRAETGTALQADCDTSVNSKAGCGVSFGDPRSFGPAFNQNGGGWCVHNTCLFTRGLIKCRYAIELTDDFVKIWFWARGTSVPSDVSGDSSKVDTDNWVRECRKIRTFLNLCLRREPQWHISRTHRAL